MERFSIIQRPSWIFTNTVVSTSLYRSLKQFKFCVISFARSTKQTHLMHIRSKVALISQSAMAAPSFLEFAMWMTSLARLIPWYICRSSPADDWVFDSLWWTIFLVSLCEYLTIRMGNGANYTNANMWRQYRKISRQSQLMNTAVSRSSGMKLKISNLTRLIQNCP